MVISPIRERIAQTELALKQLEERRNQLVLSAKREELFKLRRLRKEEDRRIFLVGSVLLERIRSGKLDGARFFSGMASTLENNDDRRLFERWDDYQREHQSADGEHLRRTVPTRI